MKSQRLVLTTATALEDSSSSGDMEEKYAMFVSVYTIVTSGMEMYMARGRFLRKKTKKKTNIICKCIYPATGHVRIKVPG